MQFSFNVAHVGNLQNALKDKFEVIVECNAYSVIIEL